MNVLLYVMDSLRADYLSCYGYEQETSPNIDTFAEDAVRYTNAYAAATWTKPSATSLLTSRHPRALDVMHRMDRVPDVEYSLPKVLSAAGFSTHAVSANYFVSEEFGFSGFDEFTLLQRDPECQKKRQLTKDPKSMTRSIMSRLGVEELVTPLSEDIHEQVLRTFDDTVGEDTFVLAWSIDTHDPYFVRGEQSAFGNSQDDLVFESETSRDNLETVRSLYRDMIHYNDRQFGRLLDELRERDMYEDTLIVLAADHGESLGDHTKYINRPIIGHNDLVYEEVIHVPLLVKYPGNEDGGRTVGKPAHLTDVYPTVTDVCNIELPEPVAGLSLRPGADALPPDRTVFVESQPTPESAYSAAVRRNDHKFFEVSKGWPGTHDWRSVAETLLWKATMPTTQLFDLRADPGERVDVSSRHGELAETLAASLDRQRRRLDAAAESVAGGRIDDLDADTERHLKAMGYR